MRDILFRQGAIVKLAACHVTLPLFGNIHRQKIEFSSLERLQADYRIFVIGDGDGIKVEHPGSGGVFCCPIVGIFLVGNEFAQSKLADNVGAGSNGWGEAIFPVIGIKGMYCVKGLAEHG